MTLSQLHRLPFSIKQRDQRAAAVPSNRAWSNLIAKWRSMMWRLSILLTIALPGLWVRHRLRPWCLEALARWDRRAAGQAEARGDSDAAVTHLERAERRLIRAICAIRGS